MYDLGTEVCCPQPLVKRGQKRVEHARGRALAPRIHLRWDGIAGSSPATIVNETLESVRKHQAGLQSFRSMRRIEASRRNASALRLRFSQSLASLRQRLSQAKVRSTTQRRGSTTNPFVRSERLTISVSS